MAGDAAIHAGLTKAGDDQLLDARGASADGGTFGVGFGKAVSLVEVSGLVALPLVEELFIEDQSVDDQDQETADG